MIQVGPAPDDRTKRAAHHVGFEANQSFGSVDQRSRNQVSRARQQIIIWQMT